MPILQPISIKSWIDISKSGAARVAITDNKKVDTSNFFTNFFESFCSDYAMENKEAYAHLFSSIHAEYSDEQTASVMKILNKDFVAGKPLTSRMIKKAINHAGLFDYKWNNVSHDPRSLSPRTDTGKKLVKRFEEGLSIRYTQSNAKTADQKLTVLTIIKDEINNGRYTSDEIKNKLLSLVDIHIERIKFSNGVKASNVPFLSNMVNSEKDCWRLVLDGKHQKNGIYHFENEQGYMAGMLGGLNLMLSTLNDQLDANLLCQLHDAAVSNVHRIVRDEFDFDDDSADPVLPQNFRRDPGVKFGLVSDNCTIEGSIEFLSSSKRDWSFIYQPRRFDEYPALVCRYSPKTVQKACEKQQYSIKSGATKLSDARIKSELEKIRNSVDTYYQWFGVALAIPDRQQRVKAIHDCEVQYLSVLKKSPIEPLVLPKDIQVACAEKADEIIAAYYHELASTKNITDLKEKETAVLTCIAKCCQDLFQHHLFTDGNTRTLVFLTMNKLLLQNDLSPVIFDEPNAIGMFSVSQIVELMRASQEKFRQLTIPPVIVPKAPEQSVRQPMVPMQSIFRQTDLHDALVPYC